MASNINWINIDETFPIAGQDNDSQGFRDNYSVIKNNFQTAYNEITDLQLNTARLDVGTVDFNNHTVSRVNLNQYTHGVYNGGQISTTTLVDYRNGPYQFFKVTADLQLNIAYFPNLTNLSKITLELTADDVTRNVSLFFTGSTRFIKKPTWPGTTTIPVTSSTNPILYDFWTHDGGATIFGEYRGQSA